MLIYLILRPILKVHTPCDISFYHHSHYGRHYDHFHDCRKNSSAKPCIRGSPQRLHSQIIYHFGRTGRTHCKCINSSRKYTHYEPLGDIRPLHYAQSYRIHRHKHNQRIHAAVADDTGNDNHRKYRHNIHSGRRKAFPEHQVAELIRYHHYSAGTLIRLCNKASREYYRKQCFKHPCKRREEYVRHRVSVRHPVEEYYCGGGSDTYYHRIPASDHHSDNDRQADYHTDIFHVFSPLSKPGSRYGCPAHLRRISIYQTIVVPPLGDTT